ncbi:hypothetical protein HDU83_002754 [Entophlyctis luteolus]|nr:hypothetical protein HDU82_002173 [Entophlyctis luteolus]KAJ3355749.1 hypothetical protein HDU83_002754 [Entophlyctis luteolus]KAJ3393712.1 hypothetical protein HDU84_001119 [Entophlyctis sp. JEL0112]
MEWRVTRDAVHALVRNGVAVVDNALPSSIARGLRDDIVAAAVACPRLLSRNATVLLAPPSSAGTLQRQHSAATVLVPKKHIAEFDLAHPPVAAALPSLAAFANDPGLVNTLSKYNAFPHKLARQSVKAQINFGRGGSFPIHCDTARSVDSRLVTAVVYLNELFTTAEADGGCLRLYPFPHSNPIDIEPKFNRLVLFSSAGMLHRVLPSFVDRLCFTIWISSVDEGSELKHRDLHAPTKTCWTRDRMVKLAKLVYKDEWAESIVQSHEESDSLKSLLESHEQDVIMIERLLKPQLPEGYLRYDLEDWKEYFREVPAEWF